MKLLGTPAVTVEGTMLGPEAETPGREAIKGEGCWVATKLSDDGGAVLVEVAKLEVYDIAAENERFGRVDGELIWMGFRLLLPGGARFRGMGPLVIAVPVVCIVVELPTEAGEAVSLWL